VEGIKGVREKGLGTLILSLQAEEILVLRFLLEKTRTETRPVQGVVNHAAHIHPPDSSHDRILHGSFFPEKGTWNV